MRSPTIAFLLALAAVAPQARQASAKIPNAANSFFTRPMVACPAGEVVFTTIMRDALNNPLPLEDVIIGFGDCASVQFPPVLGNEGYTVVLTPSPAGPPPPYLEANSDFNGEKDFAIRAGGGCPALTVKIYGDGALVAWRALASPDQDGDLSVGPVDEAIANAKIGTSDPTADFDGDGTVTAADIAILRTHLGHHAPGMITPVASHTWGTLKLLYR